jgi:predicted SAM-dependent methyltransferase
MSMAQSSNSVNDIPTRQRDVPAVYVQFGCGICAPPRWLNFDAGPAFWLQCHLSFLKPILIKRGFPDYPANIRYGDVIKGLPVAPRSATAVYSSHVLEHLSLNEFRQALRNVHAYLVPGGTFRAVQPDLEWLAKRYIDCLDSEAASRFMRESALGLEEQKAGVAGMLKQLFGRSAHLWMWDYKNMVRELAAVGFTEIRRAQFRDNPDPIFHDVEEPSRWENCLGVECRKPV